MECPPLALIIYNFRKQNTEIQKSYLGNTLIARLLKGGCRPGRAHLETLSRPADQTEVLHLRQRQPQTAASHNQTSSLSSCFSFSCSFCSSYFCSCSALQRPHRAPSVQAAAPQMRFAPLLPPVAANYCHPKPKISVYIPISSRRTIYVRHYLS